MLKTVRIKGYKSLRDVDVEFGALTVLVGPNGAGKSNLLDALQLLARLATCQSLSEAFQPPHRGKPLESFAFPPGGVKRLRELESASFLIEVDLELSPTAVEAVSRQSNGKSGNGRNGKERVPPARQKRLRYGIQLEAVPKTGLVRVADEYLVPLTAKWEPMRGRRPFITKSDAGQDAFEVDEPGGALHIHGAGPVLTQSLVSMQRFWDNCHVSAVRRELGGWRFFYLDPREHMRAVTPALETRCIGPMGQELANFLNTLKATAPRRFEAVERGLRMIVPSVSGIDVRVDDEGDVALSLLEGETPIPARLLSEGTLRILGLLALSGAEETPTLIGFEEPENGVHPRRVALVAEMLRTMADAGDTQLVVTTHSPMLADLMPKESLHVCRRIEGGTATEPLAAWGPLWDKKNALEQVLDADDELSVSERIMRGDFDA
jgi:predicted ATPase